MIVFFDEMDSIFRMRGTGISSDVESTIVPQLLSELDGVETLKNVIVIGASNREDLIDPAILRPGPPGREDQDRAARRGSRPPTSCASTCTRAVPIHPDEIERSGGDVQATAADDPRDRRPDVRAHRREPVPRGHLRERRQGDPVLQGLQLRRDDREHRAPREEGGDQALPVDGREGHQGRGPAPGDPRRVQGERGPAQHHEPRRLGADLGQEGRADRLRAHAAGRRAARAARSSA